MEEIRKLKMLGKDLVFKNIIEWKEKPAILEKLPVYSAKQYKNCGDGGCRDFYRVVGTAVIKLVAGVDEGWGLEWRKDLRSAEFEFSTLISAREHYKVGDTIYCAPTSEWDYPWRNCTSPDVPGFLAKSSENYAEAIDKNGFDLFSSTVEEEYYKILKEKIDEEKKKKEEEKRAEEKKKQKNNESVGDYNSRFGVTSTWSGDAGWMDDD
jgi:hypothetical protein